MRRLVFTVCCALALGGCFGGDDRGEQVAEGKRLFNKAGCANCHTLGEAGAKGKVGPSLDALRPDFATVQKQVTGGGPGMPAFAKRFSNEDIAAIARYVSDSAGESLDAVTAAYEPDDTRLSECHGAADQTCFQQAFANRVYRAGPKPALGLLARRMQSDRAVAVGCHRIAHAMGGAALKRFDDDVGKSFAEGDAVCSSGYYHGILERAFAGVDDDELADKTRNLCKGKALEEPFLKFQCMHGLGHGLMLRTSYDLPVSLRACDGITLPVYADACEGGVFMENFTTFYEVSSKWLKDDDLLYPCDKVALRHKPACYTIVTAHVLDEVKHNWRKAARVCRTAEPEWEYVCFRSFGRDAISLNAYRQPVARRLCHLTGDMEPECVLSVALHIANEERGVKGAQRWCQDTPERMRVDCYAGIGSTAALIYDPRKIQGLCERLTEEPLERFACVSGQRPNVG